MKEFAEMSKKSAGTGKTVVKAKAVATGKTTLTLSSKNYSSCSPGSVVLSSRRS
jgi:hypothetical protein